MVMNSCYSCCVPAEVRDNDYKQVQLEISLFVDDSVSLYPAMLPTENTNIVSYL